MERGSAAGADGTDEPQRAALKSDCLGWHIRLKRLADQVIVITGPTSGIGLATARLAAQRGMRLVLASRNETALARLASEIAGGGGEAVWTTADVAEAGPVEHVADVAVQRFGGLDTWINNAAVAIYPQEFANRSLPSFGSGYGSRAAQRLRCGLAIIDQRSGETGSPKSHHAAARFDPVALDRRVAGLFLRSQQVIMLQRGSGEVGRL